MKKVNRAEPVGVEVVIVDVISARVLLPKDQLAKGETRILLWFISQNA